MRHGVWTAVALAAGLVAPHSRSVPAAQEPPQFWPATEEQGLFVVDPPDSVDWQATARRHFTRFDPFAPDSAGLAEIRSVAQDFFSADLAYGAPLPPRLADGHYYLATVTGVHPARPVGLRGAVRFEVDGGGRVQGEPRFFGSLLLRLSDSLAGGEGGFAFRSPVAWPSADREAARRSRLAFLAASLPPEPDSTDAVGWFRRVTMEYEFTVGSVRYRFRQLAPDHLLYEAGCTRRFQLLRAGPEPELVAELNDGCDV